MLATIIASYLNITEVQADNLVALVSHEQQWSEDQTWKDAKFNLASAEKQIDVINFLQALGQSKWFKGHDRSKFADSNTNENDKYFELFTGLGLTQAVPFDTSYGEPTFAAVLGSSESQVRNRLGALEADLKVGHGPTTGKIYGLGSNRALGAGVMETEEYSKNKLTEAQLESTEANMVDLIVTEKLIDLEMQNATFSKFSYQGINTAGTPTDRAKTADTATSLKEAIECSYDISTMNKPVVVAVYSNQPFVLRQTRDTQPKLGPNYKAIGVGTELKREDFNKHPKAIAIVEGEIARLININYQPEILKQYDVPLTAEEKDQLKNLIAESAKKRASAAINKIDNVTSLFATSASITAAAPAPIAASNDVVSHSAAVARK